MIDKVVMRFDSVTNISNIPGEELFKVWYHSVLVNNICRKIWGDLAGHLTVGRCRNIQPWLQVDAHWTISFYVCTYVDNQ